MKPVWLGIIFFLVYGLFSMKSRAAESVPVAEAVFANGEFRLHSASPGR